MKITPVGNRVLVKSRKMEKTTSFGIVLPDTVNLDKRGVGVVEAIGEGEEMARVPVKIGDTIMFEKWGGEEVENESESYQVIYFDKILAVVNEQV